MAGLARYRAVASLLVMMSIGQACDAPRTTDPSIDPSVDPSFAKSVAGPTVSAATPASAHQGAVTVDVTISGSGFDAGSRAIWQLNGVPASKITVNSTRFNSSTSLTANITVAADAAATTYDIAVVTSTGKKGIGAEMFTVTFAISLSGVTEGRAISDGGVVAGFNGSDVVASLPDGSSALVAQNSMVWDIDRAGRAIGGRDAANRPVLWSSLSGGAGPWSATTMTDLGFGGAVRAIASDAAGDAVLLGGNMFSATGGKNPTVWTRTPAGWDRRVNALPSGLAGAWVQSINRRGQAAGMDGSGCCTALYWDSLGIVTPLSGIGGARNAAAWGINGDGTVIVGNSGTSAVMWRRTLTSGVYGPWNGAIALENTGTLCGRSGSSIAYDVNSAGTVIVGSSCGVAVAWKPTSASSADRMLLQGLGPPNQSVAFGVNDLDAPLATGSAKTSTGVYWWGF